MNQPTTWPAIAEHGVLRLFVVFVLYVAQGVPYGLILVALPGWLATQGVSAASLGVFVSLASLPWTMKFMHGFFMDRFAYLPMGRRRAWLIVAQGCMMAGLVICALIDPAAGQITLLAGIGFVVMLATTVQDVAVDGMAVDLLQEKERPIANGLMFGGQSLGIAAGGAAGGLLIAGFGLPTAMLAVAAFLLAVLMMVVALRERPGEKLMPWTAGVASEINQQRHLGAWMPLLRQTFGVILRRRSLILIVGVIMINASWGFFLTLTPSLAADVTGWTDAMYSSASGSAYLLAGVLTIVLFGALVAALGTRWSMLLATVVFAAVCIGMGMNEAAWAEDRTIRVFIYAVIGLYQVILVVWAVTAMRLCSPAVAATQFALYMAMANLGISLGAALVGPIEQLGGYSAVLYCIAAGLIMGGLIFFLFGRVEDKAVELHPAVD